MSEKPKIVRELYEKSPGPSKCIGRIQSYVGNGLSRIETRSVTSESDFTNEVNIRHSEDNGKTWTDWKDVYAEGLKKRDEMELQWSTPRTGIYNTVHNHFVSLNMQRLFLENHHDAYRKYWQEAKSTFSDHSYVWVSKELKDWKWQLVKYEEGEDYTETDWARKGYVHVNEAYIGCNLEVFKNGDIIFPVGAKITSCCRMIGMDVNEVFQSCPQIMKGLIVVRGKWNKEDEKYDLVSSKPVVISDLKSSRGVDEPTIMILTSGRIVVAFRGSNVISEGWNTRIQKGTPAHKWYTFSDDGGKTFSDPVPWHYDNGEVFYSSATTSRFFRSTKNSKVYWFGNITGPETYGNHPRYPLVMVEVDEETGFLKRDTHTVIDDRDPETESVEVQLSNFSLLEDRETKNIELYITRLGTSMEDIWRSDAYRYTIEV